MLKQRVITALILASVFVSCVLFGGNFWVGILFSAMLFAAAREMAALTLRMAPAAEFAIAAAFALLFWYSRSALDPSIVERQTLAGLVAWGCIAVALGFYRHSGRWPLPMRVSMFGFGLVLLWICAHSLVYLHLVLGGWVLLFVFTLVWVADIGAYFCGRRFGKRKLAPEISPGKTWEGVFGAIVATLVWMLAVYGFAAEWRPVLLLFVATGVATVLVSIVGDLFESVLKREAGVKDSGTILPGHGGVLDRIDSIIAAAPVFVSGLILADSI